MASLQGAIDSCGEQVRPGGAQQHGDHSANHEPIPGYWDVCRGKAKVIQTDTHTLGLITMIGSIEAVWRSHSVKCQSLMKLLRAVKLQIKFKRLIENPILAECVRVRQPVWRTDWPPAALRVQSRSWLHIHSETWIDLYYRAPGPRPADWLNVPWGSAVMEWGNGNLPPSAFIQISLCRLRRLGPALLSWLSYEVKRGTHGGREGQHIHSGNRLGLVTLLWEICDPVRYLDFRYNCVKNKSSSTV